MCLEDRWWELPICICHCRLSIQQKNLPPDFCSVLKTPKKTHYASTSRPFFTFHAFLHTIPNRNVNHCQVWTVNTLRKVILLFGIECLSLREYWFYYGLSAPYRFIPNARTDITKQEFASGVLGHHKYRQIRPAEVNDHQKTSDAGDKVCLIEWFLCTRNTYLLIAFLIKAKTVALTLITIVKFTLTTRNKWFFHKRWLAEFWAGCETYELLLVSGWVLLVYSV